MLFAISTIATCVTLGLLLFWPGIGVQVALMCKPIIDAGVWYRLIGGFRIPEVVGVVVPMLLLFHLFITQRGRPEKMHLVWVWLPYLLANFLAFAIAISHGRLEWAVKVFFLLMNGFVWFYALQTYVNDRKSFQRLLICLLIGGLFPMMMGLYQATTGAIWQMRIGTAGLVRNVGVYHNSTNYRYFAYMTLTVILLYWSYFSSRTFIQRMLFLAYGAVCGIVLFKVYSKAAILTMGLWVIIWAVMRRNFLILITLPLAVVVTDIVLGGEIFAKLKLVFLKETLALEGQINSDLLLTGRVGMVKEKITEFNELDVFNQMFGVGRGYGGGHNDYLRCLITSGVFGLLSYLVLLGTVGFLLTRNMVYANSPLNVMGFMVYIAYMVDTMGLAPGLYTSFQWYAWGFIGLAIHGVPGLEEDLPDDVGDAFFFDGKDVSSLWDTPNGYGSRTDSSF